MKTIIACILVAALTLNPMTGASLWAGEKEGSEKSADNSSSGKGGDDPPNAATKSRGGFGLGHGGGGNINFGGGGGREVVIILIAVVAVVVVYVVLSEIVSHVKNKKLPGGEAARQVQPQQAQPSEDAQLGYGRGYIPPGH